MRVNRESRPKSLPLEGPTPDQPTQHDAAKRHRSELSQTFIRGMAVLKLFDATHTHLSLADVARLCDLDRAVARRLTLTLEHLGYLRRDGRVFSLTPKVLVLAGGFLQGHQFGTVVQPVLEAHSQDLGEQFSLAMIDGQDAVYVAQAMSGRHRVSFGFTLGSRLPLLQTAIGRALLSIAEPSLVERAIRSAPLEQFTKGSIVDRVRLAAKILHAQDLGYALVKSEFEAGVTGMALPIHAASGAIMAIGISAIQQKFTDAMHDRSLEVLRDCGRALASAT